MDRFGVLTLAWALVGYFSLFDLGVGRALTKVVSDRLASAKECEVPSAIWSGLAMMIGLGSVFGAVIWFEAHWIVTGILRVPDVSRAGVRGHSCWGQRRQGSRNEVLRSSEGRALRFAEECWCRSRNR